MFAKILAISALVAYAQAGVYELGHQAAATSYSSVNKQITPVATLHAAPLATYHAAPITTYHAAPVATLHAAPVTTLHAAPVTTLHSAPVTTYHAAPVAAIHAAPVATYHAAPVATYHAAPVVKAIHQEVYADSHPQYSYQYGVQDAHSGDVKNQHEERDGDVVKGVYSLVQPDGVTRTVHYSSDAHNGFNAQVEYSGHADHPQVVQKALVAKTLVAAAPVYQAYHH